MLERISPKCVNKITAFSETETSKCSSSENNKKNNNSFYLIFNVALLNGLPLSSSVLTDNNQELRKSQRIWCFSFFAFKTLILLFSASYMYQFFPAMSTRITIYGFTVCGYIITVLMFINRKKLCTSYRNLCHLSETMDPEAHIGGKYIKLQIATFVVVIISLIILIVFFFYLQEMDSFREVIYIPPIIPERFRELYLNIVILCIILSFSTSVFTCGIVFILCRNIYKVVGRIICGFGETLKDRSNLRMVLSSRTISEDIKSFKNITFLAYEVDDSVSMYVFFLYVFAMSGYFNTVSVMVTDDPRLRTPASLAYVAWTFSTATLILFDMSCRGSYIIDRVEELKRRMIECSDKIVRSSAGVQTMEAFNLLFEIVMKSNVSVTGGGMFVINYGLILAIAGTLVTYGVLILQLDGK